MISDFENGIVFADGTRCMPAKLEISGENPDKNDRNCNDLRG